MKDRIGVRAVTRWVVPADPQREIDAKIVASGALTSAEVADMRSGTVAPTTQDGKTIDAGIPAIVVDEMRKSADGYDALFGAMRVLLIRCSRLHLSTCKRATPGL